MSGQSRARTKIASNFRVFFFTTCASLKIHGKNVLFSVFEIIFSNIANILSYGFYRAKVIDWSQEIKGVINSMFCLHF